MSERAGIFDDTEFSVEGFAPKTKARTGEASPDAVRVVSEKAQFPSREPAPPSNVGSPGRAPRRYRTGRNVQLNVKARTETLDDFYAIADQQNWILGEVLERAVAALKRELAAR